MPKEQEVREVMKRLRKEEWEEESGKGSHVVFRKDGKRPNVEEGAKDGNLPQHRENGGGALSPALSPSSGKG